MFFLYDILCPGPLCRRYKRCEKSLGLEPSLRAGSLYAFGTFMFEDKPYGTSLGLEPPLQAGFLYAYGIMTVGRNALAFLGNAVDERRLRTTWGSVVAK